MVGIFGNDPIDKWREKELDDYLDKRYGKENDDDEYPSLQEDSDMEVYYDNKYGA
jgi:hypothetical protein